MTKIKNGRVLSVLLALVLVLGTMCAVPVAASTEGGLQETPVVIDGVSYNFLIYDTEDLIALETAVETRSAGSAAAPSIGTYNVLLQNDIELTVDDEWDGIGVPQSFIGYSGIFNGQNHTITVTLENKSNVGPKGGLFNLVSSDLSNSSSKVEIKNLTVEGDVSSNRFIGGIVGRAMGNVDVTNCNVDMNLTLSNGASNSIGGVIGQCGAGSGRGTGSGGGSTGGSQGTVNINGCNVTGSFLSNTSTNPVGGMFGHIYAGYNVNISSSAVSATLNASGGATGAYIGNNAGTVTITGCTNGTGVSNAAGVNSGSIQ